MSFLVIAAAATALALLMPVAPAAAQPPPLIVSVAASLSDVMSELARRHEQATGQAVRLNVGGSNFVARQIVKGARADVFLSADEAQMDVVERAGRLVPGSRVDLLTNLLVVVGRPGGGLTTGDPATLASIARRPHRPRQPGVGAGRHLRAALARRAWRVGGGRPEGRADPVGARGALGGAGRARRRGRGLRHRRPHRACRARHLSRAASPRRRRSCIRPPSSMVRTAKRPAASSPTCEVPTPARCSKPRGSAWSDGREPERARHHDLHAA